MNQEYCRLTILCENSVAGPGGLIGEHGWAVHVATDDLNILFDTGQGLGLVHNSRLLGIDLADLDAVVLSHGHYDHTSGLPDVLAACGEVDVYLHPKCFQDRYAHHDQSVREVGIPFKKSMLESRGARFQPVSEFVEIFPNVFLTGEVPRRTDFEQPDPQLKIQSGKFGWVQDTVPDDMSMILRTTRGLVVLLGCAHAGLINILNHITEQLPGQGVHTVIGGTHLGFAPVHQFEATLEALESYGIKQLGTGHCTGLANGARLQGRFSGNCFFAAAGTQLAI